MARITRVHGGRGLELAEKSGSGWARRRRRAFTRLELCACLATGALLALLALPALATSQSRGNVAQCLNNLRQMGRAVQMWASDFQGQTPWRTPVAYGGLLPAGGATRPGNAWSDFAFMSNQLVTPRILACPADAQAVVATDFSFNPSGGYLSSGFRNFATSYFINLHTSLENPQAALFGDRNLSWNPAATACSLGINNSVLFSTATAWTNALHDPMHGLSGNLVTMDGRVAQTGTPEMQTTMLRTQTDGPNSVHVLRPR